MTTFNYPTLISNEIMLSTVLTIEDIQIKASFFLNFFKLDMLKNTSLILRLSNLKIFI